VSGDGVRIGIVGSGRIARVHADAYKNVARGGLVACTDVMPEVAATFAKDYGLEVEPSLETLLARGDLDAVLIATPNAAHADQTIAALEAGRHVFCQKPIALTREDAARVVAAGAAHPDRVLQFGFMLRFTPPLDRVRQLIAAGAIGDVVASNASIFGWEPSADWFYDRAQGGGVILDTMVHFADLVQWLIGGVESVYADGGAYVLEGARQHGSPDNAIVTMRHAGGAVSSMYVTWTAGHGNFRFEVYGSEGSLVVDLLDRQSSMLYLKRPFEDQPAGWSYPDLVWPYGYGAEQQYFVDRILGLVDGSEAATAADAAAALDLVVGAQEALDARAPVALGAAAVTP
jgi:myo-inositol 2-dehydrogenase / D-chiro-inositol 1-dehydrogenase